MAETLGEAFVDILPNDSRFGPQLEGDVRKALNGVEAQAKSSGQQIGRGLEDGAHRGARAFDSLKGKIVAAAAGYLTFRAGAAILRGATEEAVEAAKAHATTATLLKNVGERATTSTEAIEKMSSALSLQAGVDDELIQAGANVLLGFQNIRNEAGKGNDIFDRAVAVQVDLAAKMGTDAPAAAKLLGKALSDPTKAVSVLRRAGLRLTEAQQAQIEKMTEAGNVTGAQKVVVDALSASFGGLAAATASPADKLETLKGNLLETLGTPVLNALASLTPALGGIGEAIAPALEMLGKFLGSGLMAIVPALAKGFKILLPVIGSLGSLFNAVMIAVAPLVPVLAQLIATALGPMITVVNILVNALAPIIVLVAEIAGAMLAQLAPVLQQVTVVIGQVITALAPFIEQLITQLAPILPQLIDAFLQMVVALLPLIPPLLQLVTAILPLLIPLLVANAQVMATLSAAMATVIGWVAGVVAAILRFVANLLTSKAKAAEFVNGVLSFFSTLPGRIGGFLSDAAGRFVEFVGRLASEAGKIPGRIVAAVGDLGDLLFKAGKQIIQGLIDGIFKMFDKLKGALGKVTSLIPSWKGPLDVDRRLLQPTGQAIMGGLMTGIADALPALRAQLAGVTSVVAATGSSSSVMNVNLGGVQFLGPTVNPRAAGEQLGQGVAAAVERRRIRALGRG